LDCRTRRGGGEIERDGAAPARGWCVRGYNCKWLPGPRGTRSDTGDLRRPLSGGACGKDARHCHSPCTRWRFWRGGAGPRNVLGEDWLGDISVARGQRRQGSIGRRGAGALQYHHHVWSLPCVPGMEHSGGAWQPFSTMAPRPPARSSSCVQAAGTPWSRDLDFGRRPAACTSTNRAPALVHRYRSSSSRPPTSPRDRSMTRRS